MRKNIFVVGILVMVVALAGCALADGVVPEEKALISDGKVSFESVNYEDLDSELKSTIDEKKMEKGHILVKAEESEYYYLVVFAGEKNTGGYGIEITKVSNQEGKTTVVVEETSPAEGMMTIQVLTYPLDIVKVKGISEDIKLTQSNE